MGKDTAIRGPEQGPLQHGGRGCDPWVSHGKKTQNGLSDKLTAPSGSSAPSFAQPPPLPSPLLCPAPLLSLPLSLTFNSRPIKTVYCLSVHFTVTHTRHNFIVSNSKYTFKPLMLKEMVWWGFSLQYLLWQYCRGSHQHTHTHAHTHTSACSRIQ